MKAVDNERKYKVYVYTNKINGKKYVGQTCRTLKERAGKDGQGYKHSPLFWNAIQKYGWDNFESKIAFGELTHEEANEIEKKLISVLRSSDKEYGYNYIEGGTGGNNKALTPVKQYDYNGNFIAEYVSASKAAKTMGCNNSQVTYACKYHGTANGYVFRYSWDDAPSKISYEEAKTFIRKKSNIDNKVILQFSLDGQLVNKYQSKLHVRKVFDFKPSTLVNILSKNKKHTYNGYIWIYEEEFNKNGGQEYINNIINTSTVRNTDTPICQFDLQMNYINTYKSTKEASKITGINDTSIYNVLNNRTKTSGGYIWLRESDYLNGSYNKEDIINNILPKYHTTQVVQLDLDYDFIKLYDSLQQASNETGINRGNIGSTCRQTHRHKTAGGYIWMYKNEYDELVKENILKEA